jgi:hypothetical protein
MPFNIKGRLVIFENKVMEKFAPVHQIVDYCEDKTKDGKMRFI